MYPSQKKKIQFLAVQSVFQRDLSRLIPSVKENTVKPTWTSWLKFLIMLKILELSSFHFRLAIAET